MMKFLEETDIFGQTVSLFFCKHSQYHSLLSEILSIIFFILSFCYFFFFCSNFLFRKNPNILESTITRESDEVIDLTPQNFTTAWRIEDEFGNDINYDGVLFPALKYYNSSLNNYESLNFVKCNKISTPHPLPDNAHDFYCLDWGGKAFGENWENHNNFYFTFGLYFCEKGNDFSLHNKCAEKENIVDFFNKQFTYLSIYVPQIYFLPEKKGTPFQIKYTKISTLITSELQRYDRIQIQKIIIKESNPSRFFKTRKKQLKTQDLPTEKS